MGPQVELVGSWLFRAHPEQTLVPGPGLWPPTPSQARLTGGRVLTERGFSQRWGGWGRARARVGALRGAQREQTPRVGRSVRQALRRPWQLPAHMGFTRGSPAETCTPRPCKHPDPPCGERGGGGGDAPATLRGAETELSGPSRGLHWPGQPLGRARIKPVPGLDAPPSAGPGEATPKVRGAQDRGLGLQLLPTLPGERPAR